MTLSGVGVVGPLEFSKIPLSDYGVQCPFEMPITPPHSDYIKVQI